MSSPFTIESVSLGGPIHLANPHGRGPLCGPPKGVTTWCQVYDAAVFNRLRPEAQCDDCKAWLHA